MCACMYVCTYVCIYVYIHTHTARRNLGELTRLGRLNRSCRRLHDAAWRAIWRACSKTCGGAELGRILRLART